MTDKDFQSNQSEQMVFIASAILILSVAIMIGYVILVKKRQKFSQPRPAKKAVFVFKRKVSSSSSSSAKKFSVHRSTPTPLPTLSSENDIRTLVNEVNQVVISDFDREFIELEEAIEKW